MTHLRVMRSKVRGTQEKVIRQLQYATVVFPALAVSRLIDALPGLLSKDENTYAEIMTIVSAVDPLLVGVFAWGTANALQIMLDREKRHEESLDDMRQKAMDRLVNFFERANLVVFGVVFATVSRLFLESAAQSGRWAVIENTMMEYSDNALEMWEVLTALLDARGG